jgi:dTDP-4-amino-4,6-dideoxygalactose transaminase
MDEIMSLKKKYGFKMVEDCSHAHESRYKNKKVGTFGDINVFSMDRNKLLSVGEGGVLVTNNRDLFEKCLLISDFGLRLQHGINLKNNKKFKDTGLGFKHRIHPLAAAIALSEIKNLKKYIKLRHKKLNYITNELKKIKGLKPPVTKKKC